MVIALRPPLLYTVALSALALLPASAAQAIGPRAVVSCDAARLDKAAGVARSLSDCGRVDMARGAEGASRQALGRLAGTLGVRRDTGDLDLMSVNPTSAGPRVRFQQVVDGVPVRNGQVAVALGEDGSVIQVGSGAVAATKLDTNPVVSRARALLTARRRVPSGFDLVSVPTVDLVAEPTAGGALELAWLAVLPARAPRADWNVVVSARSGDVLRTFDSIKRDTGSAQIYAPNPVQQTGNTGLRDLADSDQAALGTARALLSLTNLNSGTNLLTGTYVDAASNAVNGCNLPYTPGQASSATRSYDYTRSQDAFEETMAYAAITRVQLSYVALGLPSIGQQNIDVHCTAADNSFYSRADNALHMGDGGVDDAEDADVIVHEFGHATLDAVAPGFGEGLEQGAIGEGFGDFLAAYTYLQDGNSAYQAARRFCVMEWDATSYNPVVGPDDGSGCLRWVDGTDEADGSDIGTYSGTPVEIHDDGRYWTAMLTCVFNGIEPSLGTTQARNRILTLVLAHNFDLVPTSDDTGSFEDSLAALRSEDSDLFGGNEIALINQCGEDRLGIAPPDATPPVVNGTLAPSTPDGSNGWYRTAPAVTWTVSEPDSAVQSSGCQNGTDPADTPGRTITCTAISDGGVTGRSLSYKKDSTPPSLAATLSPTAPKVGQAASASPNATDATAGVAGQSCGTPNTSSAGPHTVTCSATDDAGNQATQTLSYSVTPVSPTFRPSKAKVSATGNVTFRLTASVTGRAKIGATCGRIKFLSTRPILTAGVAKKITLRLSRKARAAFLKKLRGGRAVKVIVTVTPAQGTRRKLTLKVRR